MSKYGREESSSYQRAQRNFIVSQAAYAITSYILQVKDRHNGNLMFDGDGHVIHIDFGFIFSISPAGNLKFEKVRHSTPPHHHAIAPLRAIVD